MIETEICPNCGEMLFDSDFENGYCPGCDMDLEYGEAA